MFRLALFREQNSQTSRGITYRRYIAIILLLLLLFLFLFLGCRWSIRPQASTIEKQFMGVEFRMVEVVIEIIVIRIVNVRNCHDPRQQNDERKGGESKRMDERVGR
jgi:hypothetical protein